MITVAEIIILIAGAILITVSFFVPDKGNNILEGADLTIDDETIKGIVDEQVKKAKESIDEAAKLSVSDSKDKLERYMDRLTNEKMMAVNEYSDTVIQQIHKDHEEAVFLYDMIDNKHTQVKNTAAELTQLQKDVKRLSESIETKPVSTVSYEQPAQAENVPEVSVKETITEPAANTADVNETPADDFVSLAADVVEVADVQASVPHKDKPKKEAKSNSKSKSEETTLDGPIGNENVELMFDSDMGSMNNNDKILALHKEGKSNMAIAKELGLGVGEVKLVIDLFKS
ncbi:MAG: hypothetical protein K5868_09230 [Lachnospiraceae bacterium]|nr:hypothetical protein [Lachnospiraceae bacterium]